MLTLPTTYPHHSQFSISLSGTCHWLCDIKDLVACMVFNVCFSIFLLRPRSAIVDGMLRTSASRALTVSLSLQFLSPLSFSSFKRQRVNEITVISQQGKATCVYKRFPWHALPLQALCLFSRPLIHFIFWHTRRCYGVYLLFISLSGMVFTHTRGLECLSPALPLQALCLFSHPPILFGWAHKSGESSSLRPFLERLTNFLQILPRIAESILTKSVLQIGKVELVIAICEPPTFAFRCLNTSRSHRFLKEQLMISRMIDS